MRILAAIEVVLVSSGIMLYIWRWQFVYPNFAVVLLAFLIATFFIHRDSLQKLGFGSHGLISGLRVVLAPTAVFAVFLITIGLLTGAFSGWTWTVDKLAGLGRYFAFCLFQQFGLQSFFTNRLLTVFKRPHAAAWVSAFIFAVFHIPNPVLIPVTLLGGYVLNRIFIDHRNIIPLAIAQAIVGSLLALILPASWHHGLRVGPGYYR
jgi:hypothetical protein